MKKLGMMLCFTILLLSGKAQDLVTDFLNKQNDQGVFTQVNVSSKMFQLIADITDEETEGIIQNLTGMKIIVADQEIGKYFAQVKLMIEKKTGYEELMSIKEGQEEVWMYIRENKGYIAELVILVSNNDEFVLMNFTGKIDLKKISRLAKSVQIDGIEYLDKVKDASREKNR